MIFLIVFCISFSNEREGTLGLGSSRKLIMYPIDWQIYPSDILLGRCTTYRRNLTVSATRVL